MREPGSMESSTELVDTIGRITQSIMGSFIRTRFMGMESATTWMVASIKAIGKTEALMAKEHTPGTTKPDTQANLAKTPSLVRVFSKCKTVATTKEIGMTKVSRASKSARRNSSE